MFLVFAIYTWIYAVYKSVITKSTIKIMDKLYTYQETEHSDNLSD